MFFGRNYLKGAQFSEPKTKAKGLVAVVTGCSGGIGKQIVRELNGRGAKVYMLCRNKTSGEEALKALVMVGVNFATL
jgi:NAD(P)-dependent dehydrogenase (short-subunit alcohol dehydrogenase family)